MLLLFKYEFIGGDLNPHTNKLSKLNIILEEYQIVCA